MTKLETAENSNLPDTPRAGFFRRCRDYWCASYREIRTTRYEIKTPKIAREQGLCVAFVSDVHADTRFMSADRIKQVVAQTNALGADLIVLGGDYLTQNNWRMTPLPLTETVALLSDLDAPLGVVAIMGNHDWLDDPATQVGDGTRPETVAVMREAGIEVMMNEAKALDHPSGIWLGGLDSQMAFDRETGADDLGKTLQDIPEDTFNILLAHEPDIFASLANTSPRAPVDLVLSGHTHGGQIKIFGTRPVVPSAYGSRYAQGHIHEDGRDLIVSVGLGCTSIPIRFGTVPEIVLVEVTGA